MVTFGLAPLDSKWLVRALCAWLVGWFWLLPITAARAATEPESMHNSEPQHAAHAQHAAYDAFPSHEFQLRPRWHRAPELSLHLGLLQPLLFSGFNAALDLRWGPMLVSYSHGQGLDYSAKPELGLSEGERAAGLQLQSPWTTGGGIGVLLLDEAWVMLDVKRHRYHAEVDDAEIEYSTTSVGAELGYRYFLWRGFFAQAVIRYWPNVQTTLRGDRARLGRFEHRARDLGVFSNLMLGWAFDI